MSRRSKRVPRTLLSAAAFEHRLDALLERFAADVVRSQQIPRRKDARRPAGRQTLAEATAEFQRDFVLRALEASQVSGRWNIQAAARALDVPRSRLYRLIDRLGLPRRTMRELQRADVATARARLAKRSE